MPVECTEKMELVITAQLKISLIPQSKCAVTVLKDSNTCQKTIPVEHAHYTESTKELVDYKVNVWKIVLQLNQVNSGYLLTTLVLIALDISIKEIISTLLLLYAKLVLMVNIQVFGVTIVIIVPFMIFGGPMLLMESAEIAQMILISINLQTLVSHALMVTVIKEQE